MSCSPPTRNDPVGYHLKPDTDEVRLSHTFLSSTQSAVLARLPQCNDDRGECPGGSDPRGEITRLHPRPTLQRPTVEARMSQERKGGANAPPALPCHPRAKRSGSTRTAGRVSCDQLRGRRPGVATARRPNPQPTQCSDSSAEFARRAVRLVREGCSPLGVDDTRRYDAVPGPPLSTGKDPSSARVPARCRCRPGEACAAVSDARSTARLQRGRGSLDRSGPRPTLGTSHRSHRRMSANPP